MNKLLTSTSIAALATLFAVSAPASAADISRGEDVTPADAYVQPAARTSHWTGPYVGIFGGFGLSDRETSLNDGFDVDVFDPGFADDEADDWLAGVAFGVNLQYNRLVVGIETDVAITGIEGGMLVGTPKFNKTDGADGTAWGIGYDIEYLGTVRGRMGFLVGDALIYATGGVAWARVDETHTVQDGQNPIHAKSSVTNDHFGYAIGGGGEWQFKPGWTFKAEYLYFDLGDVDYAHDVGNKSGAPDLTSSDLDLHVVKAGVNYRF